MKLMLEQLLDLLRQSRRLLLPVIDTEAAIRTLIWDLRRGLRRKKFSPSFINRIGGRRNPVAHLADGYAAQDMTLKEIAGGWKNLLWSLPIRCAFTIAGSQPVLPEVNRSFSGAAVVSFSLRQSAADGV